MHTTLLVMVKKNKKKGETPKTIESVTIQYSDDQKIKGAVLNVRTPGWKRTKSNFPHHLRRDLLLP